MSNLFKHDLKKIIKDKCLYITLILMFIFVVFNIVSFKLIEVFYPEVNENFSTNGKNLFLNSLSITNNLGLIIPLIFSVIIIRDFTQGTIRNKIICGYSRCRIYISSFLSVLLYSIGIYILNAFITLGFGCLLYGFGEAFTLKELLYILKCIGLASIIYSVLFSIMTFLSYLFRTVSITIIVLLVFGIGCSIVATAGLNSDINLIKLIAKLDPVYQIYSIINGSLDTQKIVISIISSIIYICLFTFGGIFLFNKSDIK